MIDLNAFKQFYETRGLNPATALNRLLRLDPTPKAARKKQVRQEQGNVCPLCHAELVGNDDKVFG